MKRWTGGVNKQRGYLDTIGDALDDIRHELVGLREALPCEEGRVVVVAAELADHEERVGVELLALLCKKIPNVQLQVPLFESISKKAGILILEN
jgi:hypothetical protein